MASINTSENKQTIIYGLTQLHQESVEWLSTIEFWKFELGFFQKLVDKNFFRVTLVDKMHALEELEKQIVHFKRHELMQLEVEIKKHEHYLNKLESGDSDADDVTYRATHQLESINMHQFVQKFREFKTKLFNNIQHISDHKLT